MTRQPPEDSATVSPLDAQHLSGSSDGTLLLVALEIYTRFQIPVEESGPSTSADALLKVLSSPGSPCDPILEARYLPALTSPVKRLRGTA